ncbi:unnamed protein product [Effrenium voratum]|nr:unnamed protein product [Effrenium voratum]
MKLRPVVLDRWYTRGLGGGALGVLSCYYIQGSPGGPKGFPYAGEAEEEGKQEESQFPKEEKPKREVNEVSLIESEEEDSPEAAASLEDSPEAVAPPVPEESGVGSFEEARSRFAAGQAPYWDFEELYEDGLVHGRVFREVPGVPSEELRELLPLINSYEPEAGDLEADQKKRWCLWILNGMFGVGKGEFVNGKETFRLIIGWEGRESPAQKAVRKAYESACLPRHPKKSVVSAERAEVQGAVVRGHEGVAYPRPEKVLKYMGLAVELIVWSRAGLKHLQVVAGGLVYIAMFRRPLFCALNCVWRHIEVLKQGGGKPQLLPPAVVAELVRFLCLVPLAQLDFRGELVGDVTASDASTTGGGICVTKGTVMWDDVRTVTEEVVLQWSTQFSSAGVVLIGAGPPCQGVSGLNVDKKGALKDARSCLFAEVPRITALIRKCFPWCQVKFLMESVASMDDRDRHHMSEAIGFGPWHVDSGQVSPCRRPRLYWVDWELDGGEGVLKPQPPGAPGKDVGLVSLSATVDWKDFLKGGWKPPPSGVFPTFTTSRPSPAPGRKPAGLGTCQPHERSRWEADRHRFPPYQYKDKFCVWNKQGDMRPPDIEEREVAMGFPLGYTKACMPKSQHGNIQFEDCRLSLVGNSWNLFVITWLVYWLFFPLGLCAPRSLQDIVKSLVASIYPQQIVAVENCQAGEVSVGNG